MQAVATALDAAGAPATDRVMSIDASGYRYWTGRGGVVLVNDPLDTVEQVARAYGIRWLVLERKDTVPAARADPGRRPAARLGRAADPRDATTSALYPVCLEAGDPRCAAALASTGR